MRTLLAVLAAGAAVLLAGCGGPSGDGPQTGGTAKVLYAASLENLMEHDLGPGFARADGMRFQGTPAGSTALVNDIKGRVEQGDVFISAGADANTGLTGAANGGWESWYATFATSPLVIGYHPDSRFAADLRSKPWQQVITEPGFRFGSTDPKLDPKGKLGAQALRWAGVADSVAQVFPEEQLVGRLQAGQLDAGFFYSTEATEQHIRTVPLGGVDLKATYTVTLLNRAPDQAAGLAFVRYLLSPAGQDLMRGHGLHVRPVTVTGDTGAVPADLRGALGLR